VILNGNLKDFPIPEVMLFIGKRIGRLRLYDLSNSADVEFDLADGRAHALHIAGSTLFDPSEMVTLLSVIVESGEGKFEFNDRPIKKRQQEQSIELNHLVMSLVVHLDVRLAAKRAEFSPDDFYILVDPAPEITIDRSLQFFYDQTQELLKEGAQASRLAEDLALDPDLVVLHLIYLRQLGFVKIIGLEDSKKLPAVGVNKVLTRKTSSYELAAEASELLVRTGKLIMKSGKLWKVPSLTASEKQPVEDPE